MSLYDVEKWYHAMKDHTFPTSFIPLTMKDGMTTVFTYAIALITLITAKAMAEYYKCYEINDGKLELEPQYKEAIENATGKLQKEIDLFDGKSVFVRISSRRYLKYYSIKKIVFMIIILLLKS